MNDIRIYIAAPFQLQDAAKALRELLASQGIRCVSRWIDAPENLDDKWARRDLYDVASCDVFVLLNPQDWASRGTGGRHVECGYALALNKPIVLLGARTNIFHHITSIECAAVPEAYVAITAAFDAAFMSDPREQPHRFNCEIKS